MSAVNSLELMRALGGSALWRLLSSGKLLKPIRFALSVDSISLEIAASRQSKLKAHWQIRLQ
ncbi:hypothetical protein PM8797T_16820 [Gimesia maris DSM 8797]|nr:hypothetical protein PM8797T_16820 [Gimesia maris DSM 8797]